MTGSSIWIAELLISGRTREKLQGAHRLDPDDVRQLVVCVPGLRIKWDHDPARGLRALVEVHHDRGRLLLVLYPTQSQMGDVWHLGSAYFV